MDGSQRGQRQRANLMADTATMNFIKEKVELVEAHGFGEVTIKIRNGAVWRVLDTIDTILEKPDGSKVLDKKQD